VSSRSQVVIGCSS